MRKRWMFIAPLAILGMALFAFIGGEVVMLLWNWLLPPLFGLPVVSFWQAFGLLVLSRILFGGVGGNRCRRSNMTPEERERFRQGMRRRFGLSRGDSSAYPEPGS